MKMACNRPNLKKYGPSLLGNEFTPEKLSELTRECLSGFVRTRGHVSHDRAAHLERINAILGNYGVEGMLLDSAGNDESGSGSMARVKWDIQYSNAGDTYAATILYVNGKLTIGDWGSIVESCR